MWTVEPKELRVIWGPNIPNVKEHFGESYSGHVDLLTVDIVTVIDAICNAAARARLRSIFSTLFARGQ